MIGIALIVLPGIAYTILQSSRIQTRLCIRVASNLSEQLQTEVKVDHVDFSFFNKLVLRGLLIEDQQEDTLCFIDKLKIGILKYDRKKLIVQLSSVDIHSLYGNFYKDRDNVSNYRFLIDALKGEEKNDELWTFDVGNIVMHDSRIRYWKADRYYKEYGMNYRDLDFMNLSLELDDFLVSGDTIFSSLEHLSFHEQSGFQINEFQSNLEFSSQAASFFNLNISTAHSTISSSYLSFFYSSIKDLPYFVDRVTFDSEITNSRIHFKDVATFSPYLRGMDELVSIKGFITGSVPHMSCKDAGIWFGSSSFIEGDIDLIGLPDTEDMFMHADVKELVTNETDLEKLRLPDVSSIRYLELPDEIGMMGNLSYKGMFTGFISDLVSFGTLNSKLGSVETDIGIKDQNETMNFKGEIVTHNFDLGRLLELDSILGKTDLNLHLEGTQRKGELIAKIDGLVNSLDANGYEYKDVVVRGDLKNERFDGFIEVIDPNLEMEFSGIFDFTNEEPFFNFSAIVEKARLDQLNLYRKDSLPELSFTVRTNFTGNDLDNFKGEIYLWDALYRNSETQASIEELSMNSYTEDEIDFMMLESSVADISLNGKFTFITLLNNLQKFVSHYHPSLPIEFDESNVEDNFDFEIKLKDTKELTTTFLPFMELAGETYINGSFNSTGFQLLSEASIPYLEYYGSQFEHIILKTNTINDTLFIHANSARVISSGSLEIENIELETTTSKDSSLLSVNWSNNDTILFAGDLSTQITFNRNKDDLFLTNLEIADGSITIADSAWNIYESEIAFGDQILMVDSFFFRKEKQYIYLDGSVSKSPEDTLNIALNQIPISNFNNAWSSLGFTLDGVVNGQASLSDLYANPVFYSDLTIDSLRMNEQWLGEAAFLSQWNNRDKHIDIETEIARAQVKPMRSKGYYIPESGKIDLEIDLDRFYMSTLEPFMTGLVSDVKGLASDRVHLTGTISEPILNGTLKLQKVTFLVDYLNTRYNLTDEITFRKDLITFSDIEIFDADGNSAFTRGNIHHNYFSNYQLEILIDANKFRMLDTDASQNELYYGNAVGTGQIQISGPLDQILIDIKATTNEGTRFFIPVYSESEVSSADFIQFVTNGEEKQAIIREESSTDLSGIELKMELDVTPDAEVQLIFDSKVGDLVKGNGAATLNLDINMAGDFSMYGDFNISQGEYMFTMGKLLSKKFKVKPGGIISWNGDPYDADIDFNTYYPLNTALQDLLLDTSDVYRKRIPVECQIAMTGKLMSPEYQFAIELPKSAESERALIESLPENELNKQFISLLFINKFQPLAGLNVPGVAGSTGNYNIYESSSEILSNQLSHWLSQISNDFDIGFTYRPGDAVTTDEVEVALKTQLFNDRLSINGNVGMGGQYANSNSVVGDVEADLKLNESGKVRVKAFSKSNTNLDYEKGPYTRGVGVFYREEFDSMDELFRRYFPFLFNQESKSE